MDDNTPQDPSPPSETALAPAPEAVPARPPDHAGALHRIEWLERWLDNAIALPGTQIKLGLDALVGLIPVAGDVTTAFLSLYILWEARRFGMSRNDVFRMLWNIVVDVLIGLVPLVGDYADFTWKANTRNLRIIKEHLQLQAEVHEQKVNGEPDGA